MEKPWFSNGSGFFFISELDNFVVKAVNDFMKLSEEGEFDEVFPLCGKPRWVLRGNTLKTRNVITKQKSSTLITAIEGEHG